MTGTLKPITLTKNLSQARSQFFEQMAPFGKEHLTTKDTSLEKSKLNKVIGYFVWLPGWKDKPNPQLWIVPGGHPKWLERSDERPKPLAVHILTDEQMQLSLNELAKLFPYGG